MNGLLEQAGLWIQHDGRGGGDEDVGGRSERVSASGAASACVGRGGNSDSIALKSDLAIAGQGPALKGRASIKSNRSKGEDRAFHTGGDTEGGRTADLPEHIRRLRTANEDDL